MFTVRTLLPHPRTDARGLTLLEAFTRMMALSERHYSFHRTGWVTHLCMTDAPEDGPVFESRLTGFIAPREDIMRQVLAHGLGQFEVMRDDVYAGVGAERMPAT